MDKSQIQAVLAGLMFGIYPLLLNKSKLGGNIMAAVFTFAVFMFIFPFATGQIKNLAGADWRMLLGSAAVSAIGMMCMTSYLASSSQSSVGLLVILMVVIQAIVTACYQIAMDRGVSLAKVVGFGCATAAIILLNKK